MDKVQAQINHGRWICICPRCLTLGIESAAEVKPGDLFICPEEYPDIIAKTLTPNPRIKGAFNSVPDYALREEVKHKAVNAGDAFEIVFPKNKSEIERALRMRPRSGKNWFPGVSIEELEQENERYGVKV